MGFNESVQLKYSKEHNNICQLTGTTKENVQIKREFKRLNNNKIRWWHIVSGDQPGDLEKLEGEWESVKIQTGWKLEKCFVDENFLRNDARHRCTWCIMWTGIN